MKTATSLTAHEIYRGQMPAPANPDTGECSHTQIAALSPLLAIPNAFSHSFPLPLAYMRDREAAVHTSETENSKQRKADLNAQLSKFTYDDLLDEWEPRIEEIMLQCWLRDFCYRGAGDHAPVSHLERTVENGAESVIVHFDGTDIKVMAGKLPDPKWNIKNFRDNEATRLSEGKQDAGIAERIAADFNMDRLTLKRVERTIGKIEDAGSRISGNVPFGTRRHRYIAMLGDREPGANMVMFRAGNLWKALHFTMAAFGGEQRMLRCGMSGRGYASLYFYTGEHHMWERAGDFKSAGTHVMFSNETELNRAATKTELEGWRPGGELWDTKRDKQPLNQLQPETGRYPVLPDQPSYKVTSGMPDDEEQHVMFVLENSRACTPLGALAEKMFLKLPLPASLREILLLGADEDTELVRFLKRHCTAEDFNAPMLDSERRPVTHVENGYEEGRLFARIHFEATDWTVKSFMTSDNPTVSKVG